MTFHMVLFGFKIKKVKGKVRGGWVGSKVVLGFRSLRGEGVFWTSVWCFKVHRFFVWGLFDIDLVFIH